MCYYFMYIPGLHSRNSCTEVSKFFTLKDLPRRGDPGHRPLSLAVFKFPSVSHEHDRVSTTCEEFTEGIHVDSIIFVIVL